MRDCMPAPRRSPQDCKRVVSSQDKRWRSCCPPVATFSAGFYGILLAGGIPVPIYPPARLSQLEEHLRRQMRILSNAATVMLLTVPEAKTLARLLSAQVEGLHRVVTVPELSADGAYRCPPPCTSARHRLVAVHVWEYRES